jgi:CheY-like chemotaxis protein
LGIPSEGIARLFQSFSQVDATTTRRYGGTGLGLAISHRLSELMGGEMWVESEEGSGSTFHFTIQVQISSVPLRPANIIPASLVGKQVLVVDDHAVSLEILRRQLRAWQMNPVAVSSGEEALRRVAAGEKFDLAILDRFMPEMDGLEVAARLRQEAGGAQLPLVMLSSIDHSSAQIKELRLPPCFPSRSSSTSSTRHWSIYWHRIQPLPNRLWWPHAMIQPWRRGFPYEF